MDAAVFAIAPSAHGQQGRPAGKIDAELLGHRSSKLGIVKRRNQPAKRRPESEALDRIAAGTSHRRKIGDDFRQRSTEDEILDDDKVERLTFKRRRAQSFEIEKAQNILPDFYLSDKTGFAPKRNPGWSVRTSRYDPRAATRPRNASSAEMHDRSR